VPIQPGAYSDPRMPIQVPECSFSLGVPIPPGAHSGPRVSIQSPDTHLTGCPFRSQGIYSVPGCPFNWVFIQVLGMPNKVSGMPIQVPEVPIQVLRDTYSGPWVPIQLGAHSGPRDTRSGPRDTHSGPKGFPFSPRLPIQSPVAHLTGCPFRS
jgi:hypothetical protein